jgi:hypothetical protein
VEWEETLRPTAVEPCQPHRLHLSRLSQNSVPVRSVRRIDVTRRPCRLFNVSTMGIYIIITFSDQ